MTSEDLLELVDRLWSGDERIEDHHPLIGDGRLVEVASRTAFVFSFGNVCAFETDEGILLIDTSGPLFAGKVLELLQDYSEQPVVRIVYTHGHLDHVGGAPMFDADASGAGREPPQVIAHEAVTGRFDRYAMTAGYNGVINARQFGVPGLQWPTDYRRPDETYRDRHTIELGGEEFHLRHGEGETDDATWVWAPARKVLCCGDFFIWASPNAGNPQKVQRYPKEWAATLREMAELGAEVLLPGHGFPVVGPDRVATALTKSAELLESLVEHTLEMINAGAALDEIVHSVRAPAELLAEPFLRPIYDEPEFVVRNLWRLYAGWYDGNPANLKPAPDKSVASEVADAFGGASRMAARALELLDEGDQRLAGHLAQWALLADPGATGVRETYRKVFETRAESEASTMSKGIFTAAARPPDAD
jgi:alkyl sulfatase BDS1-like metallo-beta-lactamase superfamily hydrolase